MLVLSAEVSCKFSEFCEWKMVSFLGSMQYFLGEDVVGGDGIDPGSFSWWFL